MLFLFVVMYLLVTVAIGLFAARRVTGTADYVVAGRHLPLFMVITTTFATWFGSETVLGIPARFVQEGLHGIVEDPFGAGFCLILVGMFFAAKLYRMSLLTISDYYRERFGTVVEVTCSLIILLSYLGWVAAQVTALGLVFHLLTGGAMSVTMGMVVGTLIILSYTLFGGMWSVAVTDLIQMVVLVLGLSAIAFYAADLAGGADKVLALASEKDLFRFLPPADTQQVLFFVAAAITMMFGSIPQQDVYQRVMSAESEQAAVKGPIIGGLGYILFSFVPMFVVVSALVIMPEEATTLMADDPQKVIPTLVTGHMPMALQIVFFGALISALLSTASATLLAPAVTFTENILRHVVSRGDDRQELRSMRVTVFVFSVGVCLYAIASEGTPIYELVSSAYQLPLVGAFVPLVFGLYWSRATTQGALLSIMAGILVWALYTFTPMGERFPAQIAGLLAAVVAMIIGSLAMQRVEDRNPANYGQVNPG
jgi:SSS family transporter